MADSLPCALVERITRLARGRTIAGTNRYAQVSRQWRDAGHISDETEPQRLYLDSREYDRDIKHISAWLSTHGKHVDVLIIDADMEESTWSFTQHHTQLNWFVGGPAAALQRLTRLDVMQRDSLALLAPVLGQLPQLQHLAANIRVAPSHSSSTGGPSTVQLYSSTFVDPHGEVLAELPDLPQLCPKLVHLHLNLQLWVNKGWEQPSIQGVAVDQRLHQVLPAYLQQLDLVNTKATEWRALNCSMVVSLSSLSHLSALQRLVLSGVDVAQDQAAGLLVLGSLQQLRLCSASSIQDDSDDPDIPDDTVEVDKAVLLQLAPLATDYEVPSMTDVSALKDAGRLTRLVLTEGLQFSPAQSLAALTGLQALELGECGSRLAAVVEQAAGMATLRSLSVKGSLEEAAAFSSSLARCTQLTALALLVPAPKQADTDGSVDGRHSSRRSSSSSSSSEDEPDEDRSQPGPPWTVALQQLTGLHHLHVYAALLECEAGAWLAPLTALTRLCGTMPAFTPRWELYRGGRGKDAGRAWRGDELVNLNMDKAKEYLQQVAVWPASLQQVVFPITQDVDLCEYVMPRWLEVRAWEGAPPAAVPANLISWLELPPIAENGWTRYFSACRYLRGVWELQAPLPGSHQPGTAVRPPQSMTHY
jgi:hypothetical protein